MDKRSRSFLSEILGDVYYDNFKAYAKLIAPIGTGILLLLYSLSYFVHWDIVRILINLCTGSSLLFIIYIVALIFLLDIQFDVEEDNYSCDHNKKCTSIESILYKFSIYWSVVLCLSGVAAIYFSNEYREQYAFECRTYLVDRVNKIYHLDYENRCEVAAEAVRLEKMKGYQILETDYQYCEWCQSWEAEALEEYNSTRHVRR